MVLDVIEVLDIVLMCVGTFLHVNAILPTDRLAIRAAVWISSALTGLCAAYASFVAFADPSQSIIANPAPCFSNSTTTAAYCVAQQVLFYADISTFGTATLILLHASHLRRDAKGRWRGALYPRVALARLWFVVQMCGVCGGLGRLVSGLGRAAFASGDATSRNYFTKDSLQSELTTACTFFLLALLSRGRVRRSLQARLAGAGAEAEEASAAASVSAVIGGSTDVNKGARAVPVHASISMSTHHSSSRIILSPHARVHAAVSSTTALESAALVFRAISFDKLRPEHLQSNQSDTRLNHLSQGALLGEIDYFVSHSWHDDGAVKWTALQRFADGFATEHGRPPLLWLDRISLNQADVQGSLSHLPVHMAGCRGLVILAGRTYCSRLWALLELYVWLAMGKDQACIKMVVLNEGGGSTASSAGNGSDGDPVLRSFKRVKVADAGCSNESDREKILGIIEASFASLDAFDRHISRVLLTSALQERRSSTRKASFSDAQGYSMLQRISGVRRPSGQFPKPVAV